MLWILLTLAGATEVAFHPNASDSTVAFDDAGRLHGVPASFTGIVLVKALDPLALEALPQVASVQVHPRGRIARVRPSAGISPAALSNLLHARDDVRWAHPDLRLALRAHELPDDPYADLQWHLDNTGQFGRQPGNDLNGPGAWELTAGGGQLIAIIDSGTDPTHPDLDVVMGWDYVDGDADSSPPGDEAHGTACAGLAAAIGGNGEGVAGMAYDAQIYGVRLIGQTSLDDMYEAFVESVDAGASVLSNSWGFDQGCSDVPMYGVIEDAMNYAEEEGRDGKGAAVVFSAGNGNCDITDDGLQEHPAVISVAASDGNGVREGYSSFGPWVDITAPAGNVTTDITGPNGYGSLDGDNDYTDSMSGTSASAPEISGILAMMFAVNERLTAAEARDALCASAVRIDLLDGDWDETGWSPYYGCGRADAGAAVRMVANQGPPEIPLPILPEAQTVGPGTTLTWSEAVDPDGDHVTWRVRYGYPDFPEVKEITVDTDVPWLELDEETADLGATITWKVRALDPWGPSEWSPESTFEVIKEPKPRASESKGCATTGPSPVGWAWLLLPLLAIRRRS